MSNLPWTAAPGGLIVNVRLTPRGGRDALDGIEQLSDGQMVLKARVRAAPTEGEANEAVIALMAKALKIRRSAVSLIAGQTARNKRIMIEGDATQLAVSLRQILENSSSKAVSSKTAQGN